MCSTGTSHGVSVSEILAVRELDVDSGTKDDGRWQKMPQKSTEAYPYAFTGKNVDDLEQSTDIGFDMVDDTA